MDTLAASEFDSVAIFGGSGATGKALISHAVSKGLTVRALARKASSIEFKSDRLTVLEGVLSKHEDAMETLQGCSAVVCVFGPRPPYTDIFCEHATSIIVSAMQQLGIQRLVCQTGGMIGEYRANRTFPFQLMADMFKRHSPQVASDREGQEHVVIHSGLAWTIVKPPRLTDGAAKGKWQAGKNVRLGMLSSISRVDLADFLWAETVKSQYIGQAVFVRN